jgi:6-phosphogluconolactonase
MTVIFTHWPSREAAAEGLADAVQKTLFTALIGGQGASLAVAGGTTPGPMFRALSTRAMAWDQVTVTVTDERLVPEDNPRSNARLVRETLLQSAAEAATFIPLAPGGDAPGPDGPRGLAAMLPLDCVVLGMGEDMHTASLFPGALRLADALADAAPPVMAIEAPGAAEPRVTLTAPVLTGARAIHILFFGAAKRAAYDAAMLDGPVQDAPIRAVLRGPAPAHIHYAD